MIKTRILRRRRTLTDSSSSAKSLVNQYMPVSSSQNHQQSTRYTRNNNNWSQIRHNRCKILQYMALSFWRKQPSLIAPERGLTGSKKFEPYDFLIVQPLNLRLPPLIQFEQKHLAKWHNEPHYIRGRNKPKLPLVRQISDMLQTTCPPTCPLVQVFVHFVGPKLDALDRQNSGQCKGWHGSHWQCDTAQAQLCCYFLSEVFELDIQHTSNLLISPKLSAVQFSDG